MKTLEYKIYQNGMFLSEASAETFKTLIKHYEELVLIIIHEKPINNYPLIELGTDWYLQNKFFTTFTGMSSLTYKKYLEKDQQEQQYLTHLDYILYQGNYRSNSRTHENDYNIFGRNMEFDLSETIPLFTHKRVAWKTCIKELLWFISGSTNNQDLLDQNVKIWNENANSNRQKTLQKTKNLLVNDLGSIYGFQWRHFGAKYINSETNYNGQGFDQIANVIHLIKTDPGNRRIVINAWNPNDHEKSVLPPCHVLFQFYVNQKTKTLDCQLYQRSADMLLGVPFNIFSYSVLTSMIAQVCNLKAGRFIWTAGDCHIYQNHVHYVKEFRSRTLNPLPKLVINKNVDNIDDFKIDDFELFGYFPKKNIKNIPMAI